MLLEVLFYLKKLLLQNRRRVAHQSQNLNLIKEEKMKKNVAKSMCIFNILHVFNYYCIDLCYNLRASAILI